MNYNDSNKLWIPRNTTYSNVPQQQLHSYMKLLSIVTQLTAHIARIMANQAYSFINRKTKVIDVISFVEHHNLRIVPCSIMPRRLGTQICLAH